MVVWVGDLMPGILLLFRYLLGSGLVTLRGTLLRVADGYADGDQCDQNGPSGF
jgi:hypothetical protein